MTAGSTPNPTKLGYRAEIDGLRAVAVILVVLYHSRVGVMEGGFIGVDVFFVISGYLISSILIRDLRSGHRNLRHFWVRRARRLFPALFVCLGSATILFGLTHPPFHYQRFGETLLAQTLFVSNVYLWTVSSYFDPAADLNPLLHTWSLSIEEQFYLLFPFAVAALVRLRKRWAQAAIVAAGCLVSLGASVYFSGRTPSAAFFLLPTRAWELGAGALLGFALESSGGTRGVSSGLRDFASGLGFLLILGAALSFSESTVFPGYAGIVPVLGTALLIWSDRDEKTWVGRALSAKPIVALGLWSYSLYLWHWITISLYRAWWVYPTTAGALVASGLSLPVAYLSYRFVEEPIRRDRVTFSDRRVVYGTALGTVLLAGVGWGLVATSGLPQRFDVPEVSPRRPDRMDECFEATTADGAPTFCRVGDGASDPSFVAIGDSHALSVLPALDEAGATVGTAGFFAGVSGCLPFRGAQPVRSDGRAGLCVAMVEDAFERVQRLPRKNLILVARWTYYVDRTYGRGYQPVTSRSKTAVSLDASRQVFEEQLAETLAWSRRRGIRVHIVMQVPHMPLDPHQMQLRSSSWLGGADFRLSFDEHQRAQAVARDLILRESSVSVLNLDDSLCPDGRGCIAFSDDGEALYYDDDHLSVAGAEFVLPRFVEFLREFTGTETRGRGRVNR